MVVSQGWMCECILGWPSGSVGNKPGTRIGVCTPAFARAPALQFLPPSFPHPHSSHGIFTLTLSSQDRPWVPVSALSLVRTEKLTAASVSPWLKRLVKPVFLTRLLEGSTEIIQAIRARTDSTNVKTRRLLRKPRYY